MTVELSQEQRKIIIDSLLNRDQILHSLMVSSAKEDKINDVEYYIRQRKSLENLINIFRK